MTRMLAAAIAVALMLAMLAPEFAAMTAGLDRLSSTLQEAGRR